MSTEPTTANWSFGRFVSRVILRRNQEPAPLFPELAFDAVEKVIGLYAAGLLGYDIAIFPLEDKHIKGTYTDTRAIFLPARLAEFPEEKDNFSLYKLMAAQKCAQILQGTFLVSTLARSLADNKFFRDVFALVENERVEFLLGREYKGLRDYLRLARRDAWQKRPPFQRLDKKAATLESVLQSLLVDEVKPGLRQDLQKLGEEGAELVRQIRTPEAKVDDSVALAEELYGKLAFLSDAYESLPIVHYRGELRLDKVNEAIRRASGGEVIQGVGKRSEVETQGKEQPGQRNRLMETMDVSPKRVTVREQPRIEGVLSTEHLDNLIWLDLDTPDKGEEVSMTEAEREGAILYHEWNCRWAAYRRDWCALRERTMREGDASYVDKVLKKHKALVAQIRRQFEALRPDLRKLRKQSDGEELDLDAVIEALIDQQTGHSPSENVYISRIGNKRDIAVAFLVDLSGSVGGWIPDGRIIDLEKEGLILICEALQILDDKYGIYGFSSSTRKQCDFYVVKGFSEPYDEKVRSRIAGMQPYHYTRMGASIRHLTRYLVATEARIKLLILLSDGKPNDFDGYAGRYSVEDTRMALAEARQATIRTFCITIDTEARTYVPEMFGEGNYIIIDNIAHLPARLPEMYRRLTT